jgi:hypothetical protein
METRFYFEASFTRGSWGSAVGIGTVMFPEDSKQIPCYTDLIPFCFLFVYSFAYFRGIRREKLHFSVLFLAYHSCLQKETCGAQDGRKSI